MGLKMTVECRDGTTFEMDAAVCEFCDGRGVMRETKAFQSRGIDDDELIEHTAVVGERCPLCAGRGMVGLVGGPRRN